MGAFSLKQGLQNKRDLEKNGIQFLLNILLENKPYKLEYTPTKKPYLANENRHISISHSHDKLVILVNEKESTGVDIELLREKVKNIQHKFLCDEEIKFAAEETDKLITLWAAKEAIYKAYGLKEVVFNENMFIEKYNEKDTHFFGTIEMPGFKKRYELVREKTDSYILVYILREV